jgi:hypothetical protein
MDFPNYRWPPLNVVTPFHQDSLGATLGNYTSSIVLSGGLSGTFSDELIYYYPFAVHEACIAVKMSYLVGGTAAGTVDLGIYDAQFNLIISTGLTAQGTINVLQELDITDTLLQPGFYYMAIKCTDGTGTHFRDNAADELTLSLVPSLVETGGAGAALPSAGAPGSAADSAPLFILMGVHFDTLI